MQRQTDCGVGIPSVKTLGSFSFFLVFETDGDDDQGWRLVERTAELAQFQLWYWLMSTRYLSTQLMGPSNRSICKIKLKVASGQLKEFSETSQALNEATSCLEAVPHEEVDEGHNLWSRVQRVSNKYIFLLRKSLNFPVMWQQFP